MPSNHFDDEGRAWMIDVSGKERTLRSAEAETSVQLGPELLARVTARTVGKGDVLGVARLAGIGAVKRTPELIPLAHPLSLQHAAVDFVTDTREGSVRVLCRVRAHERTGVEMEAMVGASVAALAIYDMCKGEDKGITIGPTRLLWKEGGKSGTYRREGDG